MDSARVKRLAGEVGFELAGVAAAGPTLDWPLYERWIEQGFHGEMRYLEARRAELRRDPRSLLPSARSIICVGQIYNSESPYSIAESDPSRGWIARYAQGPEDYHLALKRRLRELVERLRAESDEPFESKICVDTSPLLERSHARAAGLGWIGRNTCLINERLGSWVLLGEVLTSLDLRPDDPAAFRCGTCTRCVEACPTDALVPLTDQAPAEYALDSRRCISYWTIELRGEIPEENRPAVGRHVFGCDICQDVCPWNAPERAAATDAPEHQPVDEMRRLEEWLGMDEQSFRERFKDTPIERSKRSGFLRNVAVAAGNSGDPSLIEPLRRLAENTDDVVREHAEWAIRRLEDGRRG